MALGHWGARWIGRGLKRDQLDVGLLMWDIRRFARRELFPAQCRTVVQLRVLGKPRDVRNIWRWLGTSAFAPTRRYALAVRASRAEA